MSGNYTLSADFTSNDAWGKLSGDSKTLSLVGLDVQAIGGTLNNFLGVGVLSPSDGAAGQSWTKEIDHYNEKVEGLNLKFETAQDHVEITLGQFYKEKTFKFVEAEIAVVTITFADGSTATKEYLATATVQPGAFTIVLDSADFEGRQIASVELRPSDQLPNIQGVTGANATSYNATHPFTEFTLRGVSYDSPNHAAIIGGEDRGTVTEDAGVQAHGQLTVSDTDAGQAGFVAGPLVGDFGTLTIQTDGKWSYDLDDANVQYLPEGAKIEDTITVSSIDGTTFTITIEIVGVNDRAEIAGAIAAEVTENTQPTVSGVLTVFDVDFGESSFQAADLDGAFGKLTLATDGSYTYALDDRADALAEGEERTETFTVRSYDGTEQTVTITVKGTNDAAVIAGDDKGAVTEDDAVQAAGQLTIGDKDAGQAFFQAGTIAGQHGTLTLAADGKWTYDLDNAGAQHLAAGTVIHDIVTVKAADGTTHDIDVTITGKNDVATIDPIAKGAVTEDGPTQASGKVVVNDVDDGEAFVRAGTLTGTYGKLELAKDGSWTYTLDNAAVQRLAAGTVVQDRITVTSLDGTASRDLVIDITGVNDKAVIAGTQTGTVVEDTQERVTGTLTVADVDDGQNSFQAATLNGSYGQLVLAANGNWSYQLDQRANVLTTGDTRQEVFTIKSFDGTESIVNVTVKGTNDAPTIGGQTSGCVTEDKDLFACGTLTFSDPDSVKPTAKAGIYCGEYGVIVLLSNGSWIYTLNPFDKQVDKLNTGQSMLDTVIVKASDGSSHEIKITINGTTDRPCLPCEYDTTKDANNFDDYNAGVLYSTLSSTTLNLANIGRGTNGDDCIDARKGNDTIYGKAGNDLLSGGDGNDVIFGGTGHDALNGGIGDDRLFGGAGRDKIDGGSGSDFIVGGAGADVLTGGDGADRFVFNVVADSGDRITDFLRAQGDKIDLSSFKVDDRAFRFDSVSNTAASVFSTDHNLIWYHSGGNTIILGDTDGDWNTAEFMVTLTGIYTLNASDFIFG